MKSTTSRLRLTSEIIHYCRQNRISPTSYLQLMMEQLPFKIGDGRAKVPYVFDRELAETISSSIQQLVDLIKQREARIPIHAFMPSSVSRRPKDIMERYLCTRDLGARPLERRITEDAIFHNLLLDAGVVEAWFLQQREPGRLIWSIKRLYLKAIEEEIKDEKRRELAYLTHLCLISFLRRSKDSLKKVKIKQIPYERLEQGVGQILYSALKEIQADVFNEIRYKDLTVDISRFEQRIKGSTNPLTFVAIRQGLFKNDRNPYHLDQEGFDLLQALMQTSQIDINNIDDCIRALTNGAKRHKRLRDKLLELWSINRLRAAVFDYLRDYEDYTGGRDLWLFNVMESNRVIQSIMSDDEAAQRFEDELARLLAESTHSPDRERGQRGIAIENAYKSLKKGGALKRLLFSSREEEQLREVIEWFVLFQLDSVWSAAVDQALQHLEDRNIVKGTRDLSEEYEGGRLYRLATDARPTLRDLAIKKEGHLFMDLRGFTRKMCLAKEITMADFMLRDFFLPVLQIAKKYQLDEGVRLNNLVGDAISFSGRIRSLVSLAQDLREIFDRYAERLVDREASSNHAQEIAAKGERYMQERRAILEERRGIEQSIEGLERDLKLKEFLNPTQLIKAQQEDFDTQLRQYEEQISTLPKQIEREKDPEKREHLIALKGYLERLREDIAEQKRELEQSIGSIGGDELNEIFRIMCAQEREELDRLRRLLNESYEKEAELNRAYEIEMAAGQDAGIEYGLFISYGDAAETITFDDPFWGKMNVAIAEKLNEAARGTGRNPEVKRKLDHRLKEARRNRGNPQLAYPFSVFIERGYSFSLRSDMSTALEKIIQHGDMAAARRFMDNVTDTFMRDIEKGAANLRADGWETLSYVNDIYNLGEAISGEALEAYLREISPYRYYFEKAVKVDELNPEIQQRFLFPSAELRFIICVDRNIEGVRFDVVRYVGELVFRGFESHQATAVYEIIKRGSPFYLLLERYHLASWYEEARAKEKGMHRAYG